MTAVTSSTPVELFASLRKAGIRLWREGDQLRYRASAGALTPELRQLLLEQKSEILEFLKDAEGPEREPPLQSAPRDGNLPLSFAQQRLWVLDQFEPNSAVYNIPMALRLTGALDTAVLQRCLSEIARRHEALRTRFMTVDGEPSQSIQPAASLELPLLDIGGLPEPEREETALRLCAEEARRPFDLTRDILLRAKLLRLGQADHILIVTMHHIASDGWSLGVLSHELSKLYTAFVDGRPSPLPELPVQYADFAAWQRDWLQGEVLEKQLDYWRKQLEGAPAVLELPTDRPRPAVQSSRGALMTGELPRPLSAALNELSRAEGVTLFMTLLAAFQTLLHRYSGSDQIVVGTPIAGRQRPELEPLIGFFVNTLVMRGDLSGDPSFRTLLARTRDAALGAYANQDLPFEKLVEELRPDRSASHAPLFQAMFLLQNAEWAPPSLPGLEVATAPVDIGISKFDLTLSVRERKGLLGAVVEYNTDLFEAETIRRMLGHYQTLLEGIVANPDARLSELPLLPDTERQQLLVDWNRTEVPYPKDRCLHQLFEEQVERTPDATAVVFEDRQLTYRELNEHANQLARHLQKLGVGPDTLVARLRRAVARNGGGVAGDPQGGWRLCPAGSQFSGRSVGLHASGLARAGGSDPATLARSVASRKSRRQFSVSGRRLGFHRPFAEREPGIGRQGRGSCLCDLHLWVDRTTQGRGDQPPQLDQRPFRHGERAGVCACRQAAGGDDHQFRHRGIGVVLPLLTGGQVEVAPTADLSDGFALRQRLETSGATVMQATPATWAMLIEAGWSGSRDLRALCGGEAATPALVDGLLMRAKEVWNVYGPTETTIWSSLQRMRRDQPITIGRPIANTQLYVVDTWGHPAPDWRARRIADWRRRAGARIS